MAHRYRNTAQSETRDKERNQATQLSRAIAERDRFLERHPQHRPLQQDIDRMLDKAGTPDNRMGVLALLMESKLMELHGQMQRLNRILLTEQDR